MLRIHITVGFRKYKQLKITHCLKIFLYKALTNKGGGGPALLQTGQEIVAASQDIRKLSILVS